MAEVTVTKRDWVYTSNASVEADQVIVEHAGEKMELRRCICYDEAGQSVINWIARRVDDTLSVKDNPYIKLRAECQDEAVEEAKMYLEYRRDKVRCLVDTNRAITENGLTVMARWSISGDCFDGLLNYEGSSQEFWGKTWDAFVHYFRQAAIELKVPGFVTPEPEMDPCETAIPVSDPELVSKILNCHREEPTAWQACNGESTPPDNTEGRNLDVV